MLNYLYALLESESRLAAAALGVDPGMGLMHADTDSRDSLACDLMEPVRPLVDAYVLDWIAREPLRREWFFEQRDDNCRLMASFAKRLSETSDLGLRCSATRRMGCSRALVHPKKGIRSHLPPTRLTQTHKREAKGSSADLPTCAPPKPMRVCRSCGASVKRSRDYCTACGLVISTDKILEVGEAGRVAAQSPHAQASRAETQRLNAIAQHAWNSHGQSLSEAMYKLDIQPRLSKVSVSAIATALGVSWSYAADVRRGKRRPHARHWQALARLAGLPLEP
jgi:hypothetical protein